MKLIRANQIQETGTSHDENIKRKVFIEKGGIPNLMMLSVATLKPGQKVETHKHDTMFEIFYITSGKVYFTVNDKKFTLTEADCLYAEPGENHAMENPYDTEAKWLYFGIATD